MPSLFEVCTTQCEWCLDQWPVIQTNERRIIHVVPFTRNPKVYFHPCLAEAVRRGFDYLDYAGADKVKSWAPPSVGEIKTSTKGKYSLNPHSRSFWRTLTRASIEVNSWPDWMRGTSSYRSINQSTPEQRLKENCKSREELIYQDAIEFWQQFPCTQNHQFKPGVKDGCYTTPDCNHGLGCLECWAKYQKFQDDQPDCY